MVYSRNNVNLLVLRTSDQEFVTVKIRPPSNLVDKFAETGLTHDLADVQEGRFPDFPTNPNLKRYQAQLILRREERDNEVERSLNNMVLEIRCVGGDVRWGDGDDEDEVHGRVNEGGEGVGMTTRETRGDQRHGDGGAVSRGLVVFLESREAVLLAVVSLEYYIQKGH
jgi:hypothetical protein